MDGLLIENPIKMDDLGVPLFSETPMYRKVRNIDKKNADIFFFWRPNSADESWVLPGIFLATSVYKPRHLRLYPNLYVLLLHMGVSKNNGTPNHQF